MTSERLYVWAWLPGASTPIVCGVVEEQRGHHRFNYGRSYVENPDAIPLYGIPLRQGAAPLPNGLTLHGALRDALPDAWGQHVILQRLTGRSGTSGDPAELSMMTYMRESSSDRFGALDFQESPTVYVDRSDSASLADLDEATERLQRGDTLPRTLEAAFALGTSIGGARPKATLTEGNLHWIAKFSSTTDRRPAMRHEALALFLARRMGVDTVDFKLTEVRGRDVLLVRRFDRAEGGLRFMTVSGLTMLNLDEMFGRYATYPDLLDVLTSHGNDPARVGRDLFRRIAANIVLGNSDDHARNHAALWDGRHLRLSPAFDIDPCRSPGWDSNQAMAYGREGQRASTLKGLIGCAPTYRLSVTEASEIVDQCVSAVEDNWASALDHARLTASQAKVLRNVILNKGIHDHRDAPGNG